LQRVQKRSDATGIYPDERTLSTIKGGKVMINSIVIIGMIGLLLATNFIWYWQGFKDGRREGYVRGRDLSRQGFWQE
jgi:hypothetical protein